MTQPLPKLCVLTATPLVVHFFLMPHLRALSKYFEVYLAYNPKNDSYLTLADIPVEQIPTTMERKISPFRDLLTLLELYLLFRRERFDLVVSVVPKAGLLGMLASYLARVKNRVHIFQGEVWASKRGFMRQFLKIMDRLTARLATQVLAVSESECRFLEQEQVVSPGRIKVLNSGSISGVDMARFRPDVEVRCSTREKYGIPQDAVVCLFLGRITADKGVFDLIRAFSRSGVENPNLWLFLVGPDEDRLESELRSYVDDELTKRMVVEGFTSSPERFMATADFLCLPSYREGFGMVIIEAAACKIPAVGSRIYGVIDAIIDDETGILVSPGDISELAENVSRLAQDETLRNTLASNGYERVAKDFKQEIVVKGYVDYFKGLFNK